MFLSLTEENSKLLCWDVSQWNNVRTILREKSVSRPKVEMVETNTDPHKHKHTHRGRTAITEAYLFPTGERKQADYLLHEHSQWQNACKSNGLNFSSYFFAKIIIYVYCSQSLNIPSILS